MDCLKFSCIKLTSPLDLYGRSDMQIKTFQCKAILAKAVSGYFHRFTSSFAIKYIYSELYYPILGTRVSVCLYVHLSRSCYHLLDSETGWTGELWSKINLVNWQNLKDSIFFLHIFFFCYSNTIMFCFLEILNFFDSWGFFMYFCFIQI